MTITVEKHAEVESDIFPLLVADLYELANGFKSRGFLHAAKVLNDMAGDLVEAVTE